MSKKDLNDLQEDKTMKLLNKHFKIVLGRITLGLFIILGVVILIGGFPSLKVW
jgi:hypothetical protein